MEIREFTILSIFNKKFFMHFLIQTRNTQSLSEGFFINAFDSYEQIKKLKENYG